MRVTWDRYLLHFVLLGMCTRVYCYVLDLDRCTRLTFIGRHIMSHCAHLIRIMVCFHKCVDCSGQQLFCDENHWK